MCHDVVRNAHKIDKNTNMKIIASALVTLLAAPLTMALDFGGSVRGGAMEVAQREQRELVGSPSSHTHSSYSSSSGKGKGSSSSSSKGKGKGNGKMSKGKNNKYDPMEPKTEDPPSEFYLDAGTPSPVFQLDDVCEGACVGTIITFKNDLYYDEHLTHKAGSNIGTCTVVAEYPAEYEHDPAIQQLYCLYTVCIDGYGEIAVAGVGTFSLDGSTFLITASSGAYACYTGSLFSKPTDETMTKHYYKFLTADTDKCEPKPVDTPKYEKYPTKAPTKYYHPDDPKYETKHPTKAPEPTKAPKPTKAPMTEETTTTAADEATTTDDGRIHKTTDLPEDTTTMGVHEATTTTEAPEGTTTGDTMAPGTTTTAPPHPDTTTVPEDTTTMGVHEATTTSEVSEGTCEIDVNLNCNTEVGGIPCLLLTCFFSSQIETLCYTVNIENKGTAVADITVAKFTLNGATTDILPDFADETLLPGESTSSEICIEVDICEVQQFDATVEVEANSPECRDADSLIFETFQPQ